MFFSDKVSKLDLTGIETLYTKVTQHLLFNVYTIAREIDVFVAFETMNNRGKPLSHLELLKNRLIYLSTKFSVDTEERARLRRTINESWKTLYHYLGKNKNRPLDDNLFLSMHYWLRFRPSLRTTDIARRPAGWHYRQEHYKDALLDSIFTSRNLGKSASQAESKNANAEESTSAVQGESEMNGELSVSYIYDYAHDIKEAVRTYYQISNPEDRDSPFSDEERIWLEKLDRIADPDDMLLILAVYRINSPVEERVEFLKLFELVLFMGAIIPYVRGVDGIRFDHHAARVMAGKTALKEMIKHLTEYRTQVLKALDVTTMVKDFPRRGLGYRWSGLKYFLFEYEQELKSKAKTPRDKLNWDQFAGELYETDYATIEHIYPQKSPQECWKQPFEKYSTKQKNVLKNCIGNLLPLSKPKNSSLGAKCFAEKKEGNRRQHGGL